MSASLQTSIRAEALLARLLGASEKLAANLFKTVTRLSIEIQTAIKRKLAGEVLHTRTGTLRRSINRQVVADASGVHATEGTNVRYAAIHEYGFDGTVPVAAHVRKVASRSVGKGKKQTLQGIAFVSAHTRHVVMPERSFLRSTLREWTPKINDDLRKAALEALK